MISSFLSKNTQRFMTIISSERMKIESLFIFTSMGSMNWSEISYQIWKNNRLKPIAKWWRYPKKNQTNGESQQIKANNSFLTIWCCAVIVDRSFCCKIRRSRVWRWWGRGWRASNMSSRSHVLYRSIRNLNLASFLLKTRPSSPSALKPKNTQINLQR